jgi:ATP/maltotriose-dependent transcriptional regulator MalT
LGQELNNEELWVQASWVLARLERARGELNAARSRLDSLAAQVKQPLFLRQVQAWHAWLALSAGDMSSVQRWAAGSEPPPAGLPRLHQEQEALILARVQVALSQAETALPSLERWLQDAQAHGRTRSELEIQLLIARRSRPRSTACLKPVNPWTRP